MPSTVVPAFLIRTKLNKPRVPGDVLSRARLRFLLDADIDRPVTILSAPAGFGKTTLLADWLADAPRPSAWLSLDERDGNLSTFLSYFVAALRTVYPGAGADTRALLQGPHIPPTPELIACVLGDLNTLSDASSLPAGQRLILVLDDLHLVREDAVFVFLAGLLAAPPTTLHLVLSMRPEPAPWIDLLAEGNASSIPAEELRFTSQEMATFMRRAVALPLDQTALAGVARRTEGWAAGLRLIAVTINATGVTESDAAQLAASDQFVMDYLSSEVLDLIPPATLNFLLKTSILDRLNGDLCDAVTGDLAQAPSASQILQELAAANLFTDSLDADQTWYRYHHLFQKLLRQQLKQNHSAQEIARLHANASRWFARHGFADEAIAHALAAGDPKAAAQVVEDYRHAAGNHERWAQLDHWLSQLPQEVIDQRPGLMMLECWLLHHRFQLNDLRNRLDRVEELADRLALPFPSRQHLQSEIDTLRSRLAFWAADAGPTQEYAQRALAAAPLAYAFVRANAWTQLAAALHMNGDTAAAYQAVQQGLQEDTLYPNSFRPLLLLTLCYIQWCNADLDDLAATATQVIELGKEWVMTGTLARAYHYLGCACYQQNRLDEAAATFSHVMKHPRGVHALVIAQSGFGLAATYQAAGAPQQARSTTTLNASDTLRFNNPTIGALNEAFSAHLALHQGRWAKAAQWAERVERPRGKTALPTFFVPSLALVEVLLKNGSSENLAEAAGLLAGLHDSVTSANSPRFLIDVLALQALRFHALGDTDAALDTLERAVMLAQPGGVLRVFIDLGPAMAELLVGLSNRSPIAGFVARVLPAFRPHPAPNASPPNDASPILTEMLTRRELEVMHLLAQRLSAREIGQLLSISDRTAKRHMENIYQKLGVNSRRQAVVTAIELGLLPPDSPATTHVDSGASS